MKDITTTDFFYTAEDIRNLFTGFEQQRFYKEYKLARTFPLWTGECAERLVFYTRWKEFLHNE